jgi:TonB family protein
MAPSVQFPKLELSFARGISAMKSWFRVLGLGLAMLVGSAIAISTVASAQTNSAETTKRKVRSRVVPEIPLLAREKNVRGKVKIEATISADGHVTGTKVIGGSPLLVDSAVAALKKWRFEAGAQDTTEIIEFDFGNLN